MTIDTDLDKMDDLLEEAWNLPFTGGKRMIDIEKMRSLIDDIRLNMPRELKEAKAIVADREEIVRQAKEEAEDIIKRAEARSRALVADEEITRSAKDKATTVLTETAQKTREMQRAALAFSDGTLQKTEESLMQALTSIKTARAAMRSGRTASKNETTK